MNALVRLTSTFEGQEITTFTIDGRPAWSASQLGARLGYAQGGRRLVTKISGEWADEMIEGHDVVMVAGDELRALKASLGPCTDSVPGRAAHLLLLFEPGVHMVLAKTGKPVGRRLRRFLADEVMPQLARDGKYDPARAVIDGRIVEHAAASLAADREKRLAAAVAVRQCRELRETVRTLHRLDVIGARVRAAYEVVAAEVAVGHELPELKPRIAEGWKSPTQIADELGVTPQRVGLAITKLGLRREDAALACPILNRARTHDRTVVSWRYSSAAVARIEAALPSADLS